ncbi:MAG: 1,4-alpha-glucan branching protein GlgB [Cetobacterium sp.]|uniref:1,4-alpha-glucan branching protein GlgB n=1 Tax=Cetobacterium sp. TaxID=2071632 RepID=UPI002FC62A3D
MKNELDIYLFHRGEHRKIYDYLGAIFNEGKCVFRVWAPNAKKVQIIGDFNQWQGMDMRKINNEGIWEISLSGIYKYQKYKFKILGQDEKWRDKADPYARYSEIRPQTASIVYGDLRYDWEDEDWIKKRKETRNQPVNIYEVHLGSWIKNGDNFFNYREIAEKLCAYVKEMNYNYIEIMPINEYPLDDSWGYQGTGYYAVTSRYGTPEDFMYFVNYFHKNGIGVILDWVPGHFCKDNHGLYRFDGTPTYESNWKLLGENDGWGTANFDFSRNEVRSFLISNALFWMDKFHIDGLRMDAIANILYLDFGRDGHPELKNQYGDNRNLWGIEFLKSLNYAIKQEFPYALICAEDSTSWEGVTKSELDGGLGFKYKWNMGWMNDTLKYMSINPMDRGKFHKNLTFSLVYAFSENYILALSHDEVVHGKKSLVNKMPGNDWERFSNLRLLYAYMIAHPGKKLLFMGGEFGHYLEWRFYEELEWYLINVDLNKKLKKFVKDLNGFYLNEKALWELDGNPGCFEWIEHSNISDSIISFERKGKLGNDTLIVVLNFSGLNRQKYRIGVPKNTEYTEVFSSDCLEYGGSGIGNKEKIIPTKKEWNGRKQSIEVNIPAFSVQFFKSKG